MWKNRLEAFSDGVIAIAITIMVLEIKVPKWDTFMALMGSSHQIIAYIFSFFFIAIYWNTHHHLFHSVEKINGKVLWANNLFLFLITIVSFATGWLAESWFSRDAVIFYGIIITLCGFSYNMLTKTLTSIQENSVLRKAVGKDIKSKISALFLIIGTIMSSISPYVALGIYAVVIGIWIIPDSRLEKEF